MQNLVLPKYNFFFFKYYRYFLIDKSSIYTEALLPRFYVVAICLKIEETKVLITEVTKVSEFLQGLPPPSQAKHAHETSLVAFQEMLHPVHTLRNKVDKCPTAPPGDS